MSLVIRVTAAGDMFEERIDQRELHHKFGFGKMTFVGGIDDLGCFIVGNSSGTNKNDALKQFRHDDAFDDLYIIASDADGEAMDIPLIKLQDYLNVGDQSQVKDKIAI